MKQDFNSNTEALEQRIDANRSALYDLEEWIFNQIVLSPEMDVLDLGCGTGKQIFALRRLLSSQSRIIGVDISDEAVSQINRRARNEETDNVTAVRCEIDQVLDCFEGIGFDLILSTYSIYYSRNMAKLIASLKGLMNPRAQLFISGYGKGTNQEIDEFINALPVQSLVKPSISEDFISKDQIQDISRNYGSSRTVRLPNRIMFTSTNAVLSWWMNHNSYVPEIHQRFQEGLDHFFRHNKVFTLSKNVLGVHFGVL